MGARCSLRVILDSKDRQLPVAKALDGSVVEINVGHFEVGGTLYGPLVAFNRETVILRGDEHPTRLDFLDRVISAAVPVGHLSCRPAERETDELVAEAYPECGDSSHGELANDSWGVGDRFGVTGTV